MNKWKNKKSGRIIEVIGDEGHFRFYVFEDDAKQEVLQWDLIYGDPWTEEFDPVR